MRGGLRKPSPPVRKDHDDRSRDRHQPGAARLLLRALRPGARRDREDPGRGRDRAHRPAPGVHSGARRGLRVRGERVRGNRLRQHRPAPGHGQPPGAPEGNPAPLPAIPRCHPALERAYAPAGEAPGIVCATYRFHGRTGQTWGVDIMVAPFKQKANAPQKALGNALVRWLMNNWVEMHLNYVIWWNRMNDGAGWFDYSPWSRPASQGGFPGGSPDMNTRRHEDHVHIQVMNPNRGPNQ